MAAEYRVIGPPGTGKTTYIQRQVELLVDEHGYDPDSILLTSFTRTAAAVLRGRIPIPRSNATTLHALAFQAIGSPDVAEAGKLAKQWNESNIPPTWRIPLDGRDPRTSDDFEPGGGQRTIFERVGLLRAQMVRPDHPARARYAKFEERWRAFKDENFAVDFTDMIEQALDEGRPCPLAPRVIIADEAQDFSPLQWALLRNWADDLQVEQFVVAGDPAQTLFAFAGSDPEHFIGEDYPISGTRVLSKSYRLPPAVAEFAEKFLRQHSEAARAGREFEGRDVDPAETVGVRRLPPGASWRFPAAAVQDAVERLDAGHDVMFLATCAYMLEPALGELRARGLPFHNPYRASNGRWNPLGSARRGAVRTIDRVRAFLAVSQEGEFPSPSAFENCAEMLLARAFRKRGARAAALKPDAEWRPPEGQRDAVNPFILLWKDEPMFTDEAMRAMLHGDLEWLAANCRSGNVAVVRYLLSIAASRGPAAIEEEPRIVVGTVHSVKGGEAAVVYHFPDLSQAAAEEMNASRKGRDAAVRVGYVAATRARNEFVLADCAPGARARVLDWNLA